MTMAVQDLPYKMTAEQFLQLGEDPEGVRLELVDGAIRVSPSPTVEHAYVVSQLLRLLGNHIQAHRLGIIMSDTDHRLTLHDVFRPDLYFFTRDRIALIGDGPIRVPPDLAVEVLSPRTRKLDRVEKFEAYRAFGIAHYWIIDPISRTAAAFKLRRRKYSPAGKASRDAHVAFPPFDDFKLALSDLWWPPK